MMQEQFTEPERIAMMDLVLYNIANSYIPEADEMYWDLIRSAGKKLATTATDLLLEESTSTPLEN